MGFPRSQILIRNIMSPSEGRLSRLPQGTVGIKRPSSQAVQSSPGPASGRKPGVFQTTIVKWVPEQGDGSSEATMVGGGGGLSRSLSLSLSLVLCLSWTCRVKQFVT